MLLKRGRAALPALATVALVTAFTSAPATAEEPAAGAAEKPAPCTSLLVTDPAGDATVGPIMGNSPSPLLPVTKKAPDNMDVTGAFVNTKTNDAGKLVTTANIQIADLNKTIPQEMATKRISYTFDFDVVDGISFVRAVNDNGTWKFFAGKPTTYGTVPVLNTGVSSWVDVELKGRVFEGKSGIIEIELPDAIAKPGQKLTNVYVMISMRSKEENYVGYPNDQGPDNGQATPTALSHTIGENCAAPVKEEVPVPVDVPAPQAEPAAAPAPEPAPAAAPAPVAAAPVAARSRKAPKVSCAAKARKLKSAKRRKAALKACARAQKKSKKKRR